VDNETAHTTLMDGQGPVVRTCLGPGVGLDEAVECGREEQGRTAGCVNRHQMADGRSAEDLISFK
jgi:hypothetical protein